MLTDYAWIIWLALILIFVVIEMFSLEFTFLMLAIGSLGGLAAGALSAPWWAQLVIAAVLSLVLLFFVRPALQRALHKGGDPAKTGVDRLIGQHGIVLDVVTHVSGSVRLANGETWTARVAGTGTASIAEGATVTVASIDGATARVVPVSATSAASA